MTKEEFLCKSRSKISALMTDTEEEELTYSFKTEYGYKFIASCDRMNIREAKDMYMPVGTPTVIRMILYKDNIFLDSVECNATIEDYEYALNELYDNNVTV